MKIEVQAKTVATVERERESYSLFNVEFVYSTISRLLDKNNNKINRIKGKKITTNLKV